MKTKIILIVFAALLFINCNGQPKNVATLAPVAYAEKIKATPNAQIIDVRTPEEFSGEHLDNAKNINWNGDNFVSQVQQLDKSKPVFVYCKVGGRSQQAAEKLAELGFTQIYNLQGGILKWSAAGLSPKNDRIIGMCSQEFGDVLKANKKVLVDFYAEWCAPCKKMNPYLTKMEIEMKGKVTILRLNADEHKTLVSEMKIEELPTLLLYENGELKWKHQGFISEEELTKQL